MPVTVAAGERAKLSNVVAALRMSYRRDQQVNKRHWFPLRPHDLSSFDTRPGGDI